MSMWSDAAGSYALTSMEAGADPLPAGVISAIADFAYKLPPGTSAEWWVALPGPRPEPEADERDEADQI